MSLTVDYIDGWYHEEFDGAYLFRWIKKQAVCRLKNPPSKELKYLKVVGGHFFVGKTNPVLTVKINDKFIGKREIVFDISDYFFPLVDITDSNIEIKLNLNKSFNLSKTGDTRELGMIIRSIEIIPYNEVGLYTEGWYHWENLNSPYPFRWMRKEATCIFSGLPKRSNKLLVLQCSHPFSNVPNQLLTIYVNNKKISKIEVSNNDNTYTFPLENISNDFEIKLKLDKTFNYEITKDYRDLGITVKKIDVYTDQKPSLPSILELETTTICNVNPPCVMCYTRLFHTRGEKENLNLNETAFKNLIPYLNKFKTISLHGIGEPLIGKKLFRILENIDTNKTLVQFNSNGLLMNKKTARKLIEKKLKLIDFSLDAATRETYQKIRRSNFELAIKNIRCLSDLKNELGTNYPIVKVNMTLMKENLKESLQFLDLAKELRAEIVHYGLLNFCFPYEVKNGNFIFNYKEQMIDYKSIEFIELMDKVKAKAKRMGLQFLLELPQK